MIMRALIAGPSLMAAAVLLTGCSIMHHSTGLTDDNRLTPCPEPPRCVSSQARDPDKQVPPFALREADNASWQRLGEIVEAMERTTVVKRSERYLHAEVVSPWHFYTDDLELLYRPEEKRVHVRSSARVGYYDFKVNRERVQTLRKQLDKANLLRSE
jgi:uncharacterized protein (DUF1499 family)